MNNDFFGQHRASAGALASPKRFQGVGRGCIREYEPF